MIGERTACPPVCGRARVLASASRDRELRPVQMTNNNQPITNNFSAACLTRSGNRADDIGSGKLGTRFALEFV
jgi:hypothetical protein